MAKFVRTTTRFALTALLSALAATITAPVSAQSTSTMPACTGNAPGGELVAHRIFTKTRAGDGLYEGPVWVNGSLYFSDFDFGVPFPSSILKLTNGVVTTFKTNSGTNGMAVNAAGELVTANHQEHGIVRFDLATGASSTIVNSYQGLPFNSPNDVAIAADGTIYFTDPMYQNNPAVGQQPAMNVYRRAPNGVVTTVDTGLDHPNGVTLSPNGSTLYVAIGKNLVKKYPIVGGVPQAGSTFRDDLWEPDGMAADCFGNLYIAEHGAKRVRVFSPAGQYLATIRTDANVTNVAFGDRDRRTLYITGMGAVWKLQMSAPGYPY